MIYNCRIKNRCGQREGRRQGFPACGGAGGGGRRGGHRGLPHGRQTVRQDRIPGLLRLKVCTNVDCSSLQLLQLM